MADRNYYTAATRQSHLNPPAEFDELANPYKTGTLSGINVAGMDAASKMTLIQAAASRMPRLTNKTDTPIIF